MSTTVNQQAISKSFHRQVLTVSNSLEVIVCFRGAQISTDELEVNLVLDVGHENERSNDTLSTAGLHPGSGLAVPHVVVVGHQGADGIRGHRQQQITARAQSLTTRKPVILVRITEIFRIWYHVVKVVPLVRAALADGGRDTGFDREGGEGVTTAETICANTALTVDYE